MFYKTWIFFFIIYLSHFSYGQKSKKFFRKDYTYLEAVDGFYKTHPLPLLWPDAQRMCELEGASLFYPENEHEALVVIAFWNITQSRTEWMSVGLTDKMVEGVFETIDGKSISEVYYKWKAGQPNDYDGKSDCVYLNKEATMDDYICDKKYSFVCKKSLPSLEWNYCCDMPDPDYSYNKDTGKCYKLHTTPMNWTEAYAVCLMEQSHLAVVNSRLEADYLAKLTESAPKQRVGGNYHRGIYHLGFHNRYNKGWQTVRGAPINADADAWWDNYQPNDDDLEQCGSMFFNGRLNNISCETKSFFICEHIVDGSENTQESILEDIQQ